ncbi:VOC family protein [Nocardia sp. CDC159]|uniref:VOC family protein n=1 Tax=Nocardia pulmonis TaxID=2951408 RepID=A0A9X2IXI9_9NOCA|nr:MULTISPECIES: VOC family protein [Nocardia]MCM6775433.1 VOC family protein [Nocardia pulmonis]MCM6787833.1 VOC family protein [Nocardia sp. CDC159]
MVAIAKLGAIALDARDPAGLARFYARLLDQRIVHESEDVVAVGGKGVVLTVERVADHRPPDWPGNGIPKQMHLDLFVEDLDIAERQAVALGAVKAEFQPAPERWRVLLDPAGHPFCLVVPERSGS